MSKSLTPAGGSNIGSNLQIGTGQQVDDTALDTQRQVPREQTIDGGGGAGNLFPNEGARGEAIDTQAIGRHTRGSEKTIAVFGQEIKRAGDPIRIPNFIDKGIANVLGGLFANRGLLHDRGVNSHRDVESIKAAVEKERVAPANAFGPLTIFRPGLGNTAPGPAQIARLAQYTDKLIIAYANPGNGAEAKLRPVTEVDGVPLPRELRGKVFAIGSPKNLMISFEQASDLFLAQLDAMKDSRYLRGTDLKTARATVIAHSQGGLDATLTRRRLNDAGLDQVIGKLATLATPYRGSPVSNETMAGVFTEVAQAVIDDQAAGAINALDPDYVAKVIGAKDEKLVDLSLIGQTESGRDGRSNVRTFFKISDAAIEFTKSFASFWHRRPELRENDGLVTVASQQFGVKRFVLEKSYDHAGIAEDASVADILARQLTS